MITHAPVRKPYGIAPSPAVNGAARGLWRGLAFIAPFAAMKGAGTSALLDQFGRPLGNLTAGATLQWRGTPYGLGAGISGASNLLSQDNFEPITTSDGAGTGDFTMLVLANPIAEARSSCGVSQQTTANNRTDLGFNAGTGTSGTAASSGTFLFIARDGTLEGVTVASAIDGQYHLFGGVRRGIKLNAWIDGVNRANSGAVARDILSGTGGVAIGNLAETTTLRIDTACNIVFAAAWNRALSDAEMRMLARDPFCMFRVQARNNKYYFPASGASGTGAIALGAPSVAGAGKVIFKATGALSLAALTVSGAAKERFTATGASTLAPLTVSGAGKERFTATGVISLATLTSSTSGKEIITATGALALSPLNVSGAGSHTVAGVTSGSGAITLSPMQVAGVGKVIFKGSGTLNLSPAGVSATGKELFKATGAISLSPATVSGTGKELFSGSASMTLRPLSVIGAGIGGATPAATYAVEIIVLADAREIIIIGDPREIVVH